MYRFINSKKPKSILPIVIISTVLLSGCSNMKDVIEKDGGEMAPANDNLIQDIQNNISDITDKEETIDPSLENYPLSENQKLLLEESENQTAQEAINSGKSNLSKLAELDKVQKPIVKDHYTDPEELAQFISYNFFQFDTGLMSAEEFYLNMKGIMADSFTQQLPEKDTDRIKTFEAVHKTFTNYLSSKIVDYKISELEFTHLKFGATFHRVYILENGEKIYYASSLERDNYDNWKIVSNVSSAGYIEKN